MIRDRQSTARDPTDVESAAECRTCSDVGLPDGEVEGNLGARRMLEALRKPSAGVRVLILVA